MIILKPPTNDRYQRQKFKSSKTLGEGLIEKASNIADTNMPMASLDMFRVSLR